MAKNRALEQDEDFIEDCRQAGKEEAEQRGVLPYYRRRRCQYVQTQRCRACGQRTAPLFLTDDGLCPECNEEVKRLEEGKI